MKSGPKLAMAALVLLLAPVLIGIFSKGTLAQFFSFQQSFNFGGSRGSEDLPHNDALAKVVTDSIGDKPGTYGIYIQSLNNLTSGYVQNGSEVFPSASLYKLLLFASIYQNEEKGSIKPDDELTDTKTHLTQLYGSVDFGYEDSPEQIQYTVSEALDRVARLSDNFTAIMLTNDLPKKSDLQDLADSLGMDDTDLSADPPVTSPADIGLYFKKLYLGQVVDKKVSDEVITELEKNEINDRIPADLPQSVPLDASTSANLIIAHKTGELDGVRHDAGIVFLPNNPYILVEMTKDLPFEDDGVQNEADLSKSVFDFFNSKSGGKN